MPRKPKSDSKSVSKSPRSRKAADPQAPAEISPAAPAAVLDQALVPAAAPAELPVCVDYPQQDEGVASRDYTFRIGVAGDASKVEVSIDRGPWLPCRQAAGYWWYDWAGMTPGVHRLTARALGADGSAGISAQRRFQILG